MARLSNPKSTFDHRSRGSSRGGVMEKLMSAEEVAEFLGIPVNTLYQWRHKGTGPDAFRVGRHLRYDPVAVREWLAAHMDVGHGLR
jgi:excisionase family DNA binding protein